MVPKLRRSDFLPHLLKDPLAPMFTLRNLDPNPQLEIKDKTFINWEILCPLVHMDCISHCFL